MGLQTFFGGVYETPLLYFVSKPGMKEQSVSHTEEDSPSLFWTRRTPYINCRQKVVLFNVETCRRLRLKCDGTRAETRFRLSPKRTSPFKSAGASVQSTAGSRGVRISGSNAGCTMFWGSVRVLATHSIRQFPLHFPSLASPCAIRFQTHSTHLPMFHTRPVQHAASRALMPWPFSRCPTVPPRAISSDQSGRGVTLTRYSHSVFFI